MDDGTMATQSASCDHPRSAGCCSAPLSAQPLPLTEAARIASRFKALGHPFRVQLVDLLANAGAPVCVYDLTEAMGAAQSTVSHHLKLLVTSGVLRREQRGIWAYYSIDRAALRGLGVVADTDTAELLPPLSMPTNGAGNR